MFTDPLFRFHRWPDGCPTPEDFYYNHLIKCFKPHRLSETFQLQSFLGFLMLKELKAAWWSIYLCTLHTWLLEPHGPLYRGVRASGTLTFFGLMPNLSRLVCIFGALLWFAYDSINTTWCYMLTIFLHSRRFLLVEQPCWKIPTVGTPAGMQQRLPLTKSHSLKWLSWMYFLFVTVLWQQKQTITWFERAPRQRKLESGRKARGVLVAQGVVLRRSRMKGEALLD